VSDVWAELERPGPDSIVVDGVEVRRGSRVVLRPRVGGDIFDLALTERVAVVEGIEEDSEGKLHVTVTLEDDPGRELGGESVLGHRFFFATDEIEPLAECPRILVAGIGNIFLGDDGFGVAVAQRLAGEALPAGVEVVDFGIRGMDLAYALQEGYEAVLFVDAAPRGEDPGTLTVLEPDLDSVESGIDAHGMDPLRVLGLAKTLGGVPPIVRVLACEPQGILDGEHDGALVGELSAPVQTAVDAAVELVPSLAKKLQDEIRSRKAVRR
jgi:hydrogenase maturation protease